MKTLVLYYSFEGNTDYVAKEIASRLGADIQRVEPVKELKSKGFSKFIWGGKQAVMKTKPPIKPLAKATAEYDMVLIGTPVWASTYAPPIRTLLENENLHGKKVGFFYCHDGGPGKVLDAFKNEISGSHFVGSQDFVKALQESPSIIEHRISTFVDMVLA